MMIHEVTEKAGRYKKAKRLGRGIASGHGKTCGRGHKGAGARSGATGSIKAWREGGQVSFITRFPKRGFSNARFKKHFHLVNLDDLEARFEDGQEVNVDMLVKAGVIRDASQPVKVLGHGKLTKKLKVTAAKFSKSASAAITEAGGEVIEA